MLLEVHIVVRKIQVLRNSLGVVDVVERAAAVLCGAVALKFGEAASGLPLSALMAAGLALFIVTLLVNFAASTVVAKARSGAGVDI